MHCLFHCSAWDNCSTAIQREGCTFTELLVQVVQYPSWSQFRSYGVIQPYRQVINSLYHLCNNTEPGTHTTTHVSEKSGKFDPRSSKKPSGQLKSYATIALPFYDYYPNCSGLAVST